MRVTERFPTTAIQSTVTNYRQQCCQLFAVKKKKEKGTWSISEVLICL